MIKINTATVILLLAIVITLIIPLTASAQDEMSPDQELAQREGLGTKELDAEKLPGALEYGILICSIIAAIGVVKYL